MPIDPTPPGDSGGGGGGDTSGGGGGGGGGGGNTSSGGPSTSSAPAPKVDTYLDIFKQDAVARQKASTFASLYEQLWGEPATESYLIKAVNTGMNSWEFAAHERSKPEWSHTKAYKDQMHTFAGLLASLGVG